MEPEATPSRLRLLLRPGALGSLRLPHRVVMGAMHLGFESRQGGGAAMAAFYGARARAGAGLMVTGGAAVSREGAGGRNYGRLDADEDRRLFAEAAAEVHRQGGLIALQLFHAGRYASPQAFGLQPVAPSAVYSRYSRCEPRALSPKEVEGTLEDFSRGAGWARRLGFDAVEVMGSEGYLVDQFLSPLTNLRTDDFGGDPPRRRRFGLAVLARVRQAVGSDFPVIFRFTGWDLMPGGTPRRESLDFAQELARAGADALNVGIGWHESPVPTVQALVPPGAWTGVAARVKRAVGEVPVMAGTRINRLLAAERMLAATGIDFVSMARPFLADPELMEKARSGRAVNVCIACNQACIDRSLDDRAVSCMVNPRAGHESEPESPTVSGPAASPGMPRLRLAVVGAGPAGLEAARDLALLGHRVELFEASSSLGGQFLLARRVPGKADFGSTVAYFGAELSRLGVRVHLRRQIGAADQVLLAGYDGLVVATGVRPRPVDIPISGTPRILSYPEAFAKGALEGRVAVVGGGGIGVDIAHLASHGEEAGKGIARFRRAWGLARGRGPGPRSKRAVAVLQRGQRLGVGIGRSSRWAVLAELRHQGVEVLSGVAYRSIGPDGVRIRDGEGAARVVSAETVVIAAGQQPETSVADLARAAGVPLEVVGGARDVVGLDAVRAFAEGREAAARLSRPDGAAAGRARRRAAAL